MVDRLENERNSTFEEKQHSARKTALGDKTNLRQIAGSMHYHKDIDIENTIDGTGTTHNKLDGADSIASQLGSDAHKPNGSTYRIDSTKYNEVPKIELLQKEDPISDHTSLPKETVLEGIYGNPELYDDVELSDVYKTKEMLENLRLSGKRVTFNENNNIYSSIPAIFDSSVISQDSALIDRPFGHIQDSSIQNVAPKPHFTGLNYSYEQSSPLRSQRHISHSSNNTSNSSIGNDNINSVSNVSIGNDNMNSTVDNTQMSTNGMLKNGEYSPDPKRIGELEREFNVMVQTQRDALKFKSKIYQFIHSEILAMRREFAVQTEALERENTKLAGEVSTLNKKLEKMKSSVGEYNKEVLNKIQAWKSAIEKEVHEYLRKKSRIS